MAARMACLLMVSAALMALTALSAWADFERSLYSEEKMAILRNNLDKYEWAQKQRDAEIARAEQWVAYDDEKLRNMVVPPDVPRAYDIHNFGCPVHGVEANAKGLYTWKIDPDRPYKIVCPAGGEEYPANDFAAYLASGMQDKSLLFNPEHPDPADPLHKQYVDDGWGWNKEGDPTNYWFVAYYAHWSMRQFTLPAIESLGMAALLSDDLEQARVYAHKCAVLLWQFAEYYPDYYYEKQSREGKEHNPNYLGRYTNMIWECGTPGRCAAAFDAIRPFLAEDRELEALTGKSVAEIDATIRERLLLTGARDIMDGSGRTRGNYGMHQNALITIAAVLKNDDVQPTVEEMIQYVVNNPRPATSSDIGIEDALVNLLHRDGMPQESIGYNYGWVSNLATIASSLADVDINFFTNPRFQKLLTWPLDVRIAGRFVPPLGDTGNMFAAAGSLNASQANMAVRHWPDPRMVQIARANPGAGHNLFDEPTEELLQRLPESDPVEFGAAPFHFPAYGLAYLQHNGGTTPTASMLFYGDYRHHAHADQLNMLLFSHGNAMLTDIGYPEQTDSRNYRRYGFFGNTISHNTVVVDAARQTRGPGKLHGYQPEGFAQFVDASCDGAYSGTVDMYRRANMLVEISPDQRYVFDVFYVRGGKQHDYVALGPPSETTCEPSLGPVQEQGTLAGPDVPYAHFYDHEEYAAAPLGSISYGGYRGSGFQYLFNVRRAPLNGQAVFEWRLKEPAEGHTKYPWEGIGLRAHLLGTGEEVIAADSKPQSYDYLPDTIQYMLRRHGDIDHEVEGGLNSAFVTVYEPYEETPFIAQVRPVSINPDDGQATAARIELTDGMLHYVFHSLAPEQSYVLDEVVRVTGHCACLVLDAGGQPQKVMLYGGTELGIGSWALQGKGWQKTQVVSVDYESGVVQLAAPLLTGPEQEGLTVLVEADGFTDSLCITEVLDETRFALGDQDTRVAGGPVNEILPEQSRLVTSVATPHAKTGMTVLNGLLQPQGRWAEGDRVTVDRGDLGSLSADSFPSGADGSHPRFWVVMVGPGDDVWVPSLTVVERVQ